MVYYLSVYEGNHTSVNTDHGDKQEILSLTQSFQSQLDQQYGSGNNQHITLEDSHYSFLSHIASIKKFISGDLVSGLTLNLLILGAFTLSIRNAKYRMKIYTKFNLVIWLRLVKFTE